MDRPDFTEIKSYAEFCKYYWYRAQLQAICKSLGLEYEGNKKDLYAIIEAYFDGTVIPHRPKRACKPTTDELTLETGLLDCGFNFGRRFREFFIRVTGDRHFKYTADTVATVRAVKANGDHAFTLGDLLDVKLGKATYAKYDASFCRWNRFLKDFCADPANAVYPDKLKVASLFWKLLRESDLPKVYDKDFIESNRGVVLCR